MQRNQKVIDKLKKMTQQLNFIKSGLYDIKKQHNTFKFVDCLPNSIKKIHMQSLLASQKQNINCSNKINNNSQTHKKNYQSLMQNGQDKENKCLNAINSNVGENKQSIIRMNTVKIKTYNEQKQSIADIKGQTQALRAKILNQLSQIKKIQKQQLAIGKANKIMKQSNSEQKRNYRDSLSKDSKSSKSNKYSQSSYIKQKKNNNYQNIFMNQSKNSMNGSQISVSIPLTLKVKPQTLKCPSGHSFYEGNINQKGLPQGNGRIDVCCKKLPKQFGGPSLKDAEFYQGQFKDGKFDGFGTLKYRGGVKYVGQFRQGLREGRGSLYHNGKAETAKWHKDGFVSII